MSQWITVITSIFRRIGYGFCWPFIRFGCYLRALFYLSLMGLTQKSRQAWKNNWFFVLIFPWPLIVGVVVLAWKWILFWLAYVWVFVLGPLALVPGGAYLAAAYHSPQDVIGDLGGMPVKIPAHVAHLVEYNGDESWKPRKGPVPVRTQESKLRAFSFDVRYPDMAILSSSELEKDKKRPFYENNWLSGGISSGEHYPGHGFMDQFVRLHLETPHHHWWGEYERLPKKKFGLTPYVVAGIDPKTSQPARLSEDAKDWFVYRDPKTNQVKTHIECWHGIIENCTQEWSLEEKNLKIKVNVTYYIHLLPEWKNIQQKTTEFILDFRVSDPIVSVSAASN
jgi:hypothetical protein